MILFSFYLSSLLGRAGRYVEAKEGIVICSQSSEVIIFQATLHTAFIKAQTYRHRNVFPRFKDQGTDKS